MSDYCPESRRFLSGEMIQEVSELSEEESAKYHMSQEIDSESEHESQLQVGPISAAQKFLMQQYSPTNISERSSSINLSIQNSTD